MIFRYRLFLWSNWELPSIENLPIGSWAKTKLLGFMFKLEENFDTAHNNFISVFTSDCLIQYCWFMCHQPLYGVLFVQFFGFGLESFLQLKLKLLSNPMYVCLDMVYIFKHVFNCATMSWGIVLGDALHVRIYLKLRQCVWRFCTHLNQPFIIFKRVYYYYLQSIAKAYLLKYILTEVYTFCTVVQCISRCTTADQCICR